MTRTFLSLGTIVCLAFAAACNAKIADVGSEGADAGYSEPTGDGIPGYEADASTDPSSDASADFDGGTVYDASPEDDASPGDDASVGDGGCPPPPPPPPPCGCPGADASADAAIPDDAAPPGP